MPCVFDPLSNLMPTMSLVLLSVSNVNKKAIGLSAQLLLKFLSSVKLCNWSLFCFCCWVLFHFVTELTAIWKKLSDWVTQNNPNTVERCTHIGQFLTSTCSDWYTTAELSSCAKNREWYLFPESKEWCLMLGSIKTVNIPNSSMVVMNVYVKE